MFYVFLVQSAIVLILGSGLSILPMQQHAKSWPPMKTFDIWDMPKKITESEQPVDYSRAEIFEKTSFSFDNVKSKSIVWKKLQMPRKNRVLNFFPVSVDGECLSDDGRRFGVCLNVYECRMQGGSSHGECAMGFGVCCVFVAECEQEIKNNITYVVSPNFPNFMPLNMTSCRVKIRMISEDISQLRIDFNHFLLGQPNRRTGVCDGDVFAIKGGLGGTLNLCGQNSGQHMYYEIGATSTERNLRQMKMQNATDNVASMAANLTASTTFSSNFSGNGAMAAARDSIEILMNFTRSSLVSFRLWEIRVTQIPFSQRAPSGCLQHYTGQHGIIQTFNFADNGRHLANQDYRACIRQESNMCSITYEPCDEQSFRIGPNDMSAENGAGMPTEFSGTSPAGGAINSMLGSTVVTEPTQTMSASTPLRVDNSTTTSTTTTQMTSSTSPETTTTTTTTSTTVQSDDPDDVEGSGGGDTVPVRGGFDIFAFFRNAFGFRRSMRSKREDRQLYSTCTDRITIPCIIEDFIEGGLGPLPDCEPIHCGSRFCSLSGGACRIESTVIPFRVGIHFGDGVGKGNPEDNIGMCLRYNQIECM